MTAINFKCKKCSRNFNFETGGITFGKRLSFEKEINCPKCRTREIKDIVLTELGQTQIAELYCSKTNENIY